MSKGMIAYLGVLPLVECLHEGAGHDVEAADEGVVLQGLEVGLLQV